MDIYIIRHTTPEIETGICYGQSDIPINNNFIEESNKIIRTLPDEIDVVFSSPLKRCKALADKIVFFSKQHPLFNIDDRLMEMNFGKWEMKKWDDIDRKEFDVWAEDVVNVNVPEGESFLEMNNRVKAFYEELIKTNYKTVLIITHAGAIRCFLSIANSIELEETLKIPIDYATVRIISI